MLRGFLKKFGKAVGKNFEVSPEINIVEAIKFFFWKGGWAFLRGTLCLIFIDAKFPFFLGRRTTVSNYRMLKFGARCVVGDNCHINSLSVGGVIFEDRVTLREFSWIQLTSSLDNPGTQLKVGADTYIGPFAKLGAGGPVVIGSKCQFGPGLTVVAEEHDISSGRSNFDEGVSRVGVVIGDECWFGANVTVLDGVQIGSGCILGAGSVVTKSLPPNSIAVGTPARVIRQK